MSPPPLPITVVVLTRNEEANLGRCLESVRGWARDVFVVDSGSTDRTLEIARSLGARTFEHDFRTHADQWAWALESLPIDTDWVLGLDADQRVTPDLRRAVRRRFGGPGGPPDGVDGFYVHRRQRFRGRPIRYGGYQSRRLLKLFRRDAVELDPGELVDHHFHVRGPVETLPGALVEENRKEDDLSFWIRKHADYARRQAREELRWRRGERRPPIEPDLFGTPDQRTLQLKRVWHRLPLFVRPILYFLYRYVVRLGFLDGKEGLIFHTLHALWYRFLVDAHLDRLLAGEGDADGRRDPRPDPHGERAA